MILLELAAQGVRGFAPAGGRATLRPGYNVVSADGAVLRRLVDAVLHPHPRDAEAFPRAPGSPAGAPLRAGLTLVGDDGVTYRLVRDFAAACQLHRFDPLKRSFAPVAQDLAAVAAFLHRDVGVPSPGRHRSLLTISGAELPSRQPGATPPSALPARGGRSPEDARRRIAELRAELDRARRSEALQYQLDGLQARAFKLDEALRAGAQLREGLERTEAARAELAAVADVAVHLGDADAKLAAYERARARRDEALARAAAERESLAEVEARGEPSPLSRDGRFWAGLGAGAAAALVGVASATAAPAMRYVALLDVPAFGWSAWVALRWIASVERFERAARRRRVVDDWERKVLEQLDRDLAEVRAAMERLGVTRVSELREALGRVADADSVVAEWRRRVEEWEAAPDARAARGERDRLEAELRSLEARLGAEAGGFVRDARSIEQEVARLEAEAAAPVAAAPPPAPAPVRPPDPLRALLEGAAAALGGSAAGAARPVAGRASQALAGLSFQRLAAIEVDDRGNVAVQTGGRATPAAVLPAADRDLVFLALKLAFVEQALAAGKRVAVADDAFAGLSDGARRFAARLLKQIARSGQLVHATTDPAFREAADHVA